VEVVSSSNTEGEIEGKRSLYREIGAEDVGIVGPEEEIRFSPRAKSTSPDLPQGAPLNWNLNWNDGPERFYRKISKVPVLMTVRTWGSNVAV
jgi:Uma2 family endonuclease